MTESFREWRARLDFTQAEAAAQLGVSRATIQLWERGRRYPSKYPDSDRLVRIPRTVRLAMLAIKYLPADRIAEIDD